jgi:hypothetical protein
MRITPYSKNLFLIGLFGLVVMTLTVLLGVDNAMADSALPVSKANVQEAYGKLPLYFEANQGQTDRRVKFLNRGRGYSLFLTPTEAVLALSPRPTEGEGQGEGAVLRMRFVGANLKTRVEGQEKLPGIVNYFIGNDPKKWRTNIPTYAKVRHKNVYPGVDLVYYGNQRQLEYDFVVAPGADPNRIKLAFQGAEDIRIDGQGDLILQVSGGGVRLLKPNVYQNINGKKQIIAARYILQASSVPSPLEGEGQGEGAGVPVQVGFQVAAYDTSRPLIIDPVLFYSTYLGGNGSDAAFGIAVDAAGNGYVTGGTDSTDFPTTPGAFQTAGNGVAFVTKLNPTGSGLVYSTYLGGTGGVSGFGIAVDAAGNAYLIGVTSSTNFPTTVGAFQSTFGGDSDAFATKLNPTGSGLVYSTYLGGTADEFGFSIAVDSVGNAYATGRTGSANFPTTVGAFQTTFAGGLFDGFVTKLNPTGSGLVYSTYLGGSGTDSAVFAGIAVDTVGNAYVTAETGSTNFPTTPGAFDTSLDGGDCFVTKLDPTGAALAYSTYLGGSGGELCIRIALDTAGNAYVTGSTDSTNFPTTAGAFQTIYGGGLSDVIVTKLNPFGSGLLYSTYIGGTGDDEGAGIALDAAGNAYVTGFTDSTNFPTTVGAFQPASAGDGDAFVTKLNPSGSGLVYSSYLGGGGFDWSLAVALDALPNPNAYVTGQTDSTNFPTTPGAFQTTNGGDLDAFAAKITEAAVPPGPFTARVTGGGTIDVVGGIGTFSFLIQQSSTGELSGQLQYFNHASSAQVQSETYTSLTIVLNTATFDGTCIVNGSPCTFTVNVTDNGEPGTTDTFTISVDGGPTEGGVLRSGNILITQ